MKELARTTDPVKLSALKAALGDAGLNALVFDAAVGSLYQAAIPVRLMVADADLARARAALVRAGFHRAADGDWDFGGPGASGACSS